MKFVIFTFKLRLTRFGGKSSSSFTDNLTSLDNAHRKYRSKANLDELTSHRLLQDNGKTWTQSLFYDNSNEKSGDGTLRIPKIKKSKEKTSSSGNTSGNTGARPQTPRNNKGGLLLKRKSKKTEEESDLVSSSINSINSTFL